MEELTINFIKKLDDVKLKFDAVLFSAIVLFIISDMWAKALDAAGPSEILVKNRPDNPNAITAHAHSLRIVKGHAVE